MSGPLLLIGGREDRNGTRTLLQALAHHAGSDPLLLLPLASRRPAAYVARYRSAFAGLLRGPLLSPPIEGRGALAKPELLAALDGAGVIFLTGGDQRYLMQRIRGSPLEQRLRAVWRAGAMIAGTSAGASVIGRTMMVGGRSGSTVAPGLGFLDGVLVDQHFSQRRRLRRLLDGLRCRPDQLGVGIDEDTGLLVASGQVTVLGSGDITVMARIAPGGSDGFEPWAVRTLHPGETSAQADLAPSGWTPPPW